MSLAAEPTRLQETAETLLATAERCRRLARGITDLRAIAALWQLAEESEERANVLKRGGDNGVRT
jgi:hypothetical protein